MSEEVEHPAVTTLREYLRIPSVHPNINYGDCVKLLRKLGTDSGLDVRTTILSSGKPVVVMTLVGADPALPSILLNSHMDVVPVFREQWKYDPFSAYKDSEGNIWARGSQDMKSVGIMFVEAVRRLKEQGVPLDRTIHISFVPDEESPPHGMEEWVKTKDFKSLNVGCSLDESFATPLRQFIIFGAERTHWVFEVHCTGVSGHSSMLPEDTAAGKLRTVIDALLDFREQERGKLRPPIPDLSLGEVTSVNMTLLSGGVQSNVIPPEYVATFDCRISPNLDLDKFEDFINGVCSKAGKGVTIKYLMKEPRFPSTKHDDSNPYWVSLKSACDQMGIETSVITCPGGTDARFVRGAGASAFGFTALNETPLLLHNNNEHVNEKKFLTGIDIYFNVVKSLANTK